MATQTPNLNLNKPDIGGDESVWGTQLNQNADILDAAIPANTTAINDLETSQKQLLVDMLNLQEPVGMVKHFNSNATIPAAWAECDGTNGTPDLRERVIVAVASSQRGRRRGSTIWSQNSVTGSTSTEPDHAHSMGSSVADTFSGNTGNTQLTRAHLPAEGLSVNGAGTYLTDRNTGNLAFDCSGTGTNVYRDTVGDTENLGSGAGHGHDMTHGHNLSGQTTNSGGHQHTTSTLLGATHGLRAIQKIRLLVVGDLP